MLSFSTQFLILKSDTTKDKEENSSCLDMKIEVQASINNLRFSEILKCAENCKYLYELDYEKAQKVLVISNGISDIRQQIFEKIKHQFCNLATL